MKLVNELTENQCSQLRKDKSTSKRTMLERSIGLVHVDGHIESYVKERRGVNLISKDLFNDLGKNLLRVPNTEIKVDSFHYESLKPNDYLGWLIEDLIVY